MYSLNIREVFIVIGALGRQVAEVLGDGSRYGVHLEYIEQDTPLGLAHAVGRLEGRIDRPFLLMLGDIFFDAPDLAAMVRAFEGRRPAAVLAVKEETRPETVRRNFSVTVDEEGLATRVVEKPRVVSGLLKGCGVYLFDGSIFDAVRHTPRTELRNEYELTDSVQILIDRRLPVRVARVVEWDMNLTVVGDLIECCTYQLRKMNRQSLVGEGCSIAQGVELHETVVGDRVHIARPARFQRCVILPDLVIEGGGSYRDCVFTEDGALEG